MSRPGELFETILASLLDGDAGTGDIAGTFGRYWHNKSAAAGHSVRSYPEEEQRVARRRTRQRIRCSIEHNIAHLRGCLHQDMIPSRLAGSACARAPSGKVPPSPSTQGAQ
jgi:hypothetical protein